MLFYRLALSRLLSLSISLISVTFWCSSAFAQAEAAAPGANPVTTGGMLARMGVMFVMVFMIFQVLVIKPQKKKLEAQAKLAAEMRKGDYVITSGGLIGRVVTIEKDVVVLDVAQNVRIKFETSSIVRRVEQQQKEAA